MLLFNPPTGSGKTYNVLNWIFSNYKEYCKDGRKIFFITNLKKNLPHEELRDKFFKPNKKLGDYDKDVAFIDSNSDSLINNFAKVQDEVNEYLRNNNTYRDIKYKVNEIHKYEGSKHRDKSNFRAYVTQLRDEIRNNLERDFRLRIEKFLKENYPNSAKRINAIKNDPDLRWIGELYPAVFTSKKKVYFLSIDKFYHKNSTLVEPSYSFIDNEITKDAIVFIDEFDATKDNLLNNIIESGKSRRVDYIHLFTEIYWALSNNVLPRELIIPSIKRKQQIEAGYSQDLENIHQSLLDKAVKIVNEYDLKFSFKAIGIDSEKSQKRNLLFHDFHYHSVYRNNKRFIELKKNEESMVNEIVFVDQKPVTGKNIVVLLNQIKGFLNSFNSAIRNMGENYQQREEEKRIKNPNSSEFTFDHAVNSLLEEFGLDNRNKRFIIDQILNKRNTHSKKQSEQNGLNYDLSFYENGFRYFDFVDDDSHNTKTKTFIYNFDNTPEKFMLKLSEKAKVIGISATALIETVTGNYDITYFKRQLGDKFIQLSKDEKTSLRKSFNAQNKYYDKIKIHTVWYNFEGVEKEFCELLEDQELGIDIHRKLKATSSNLNEYLLKRYLKIGKAFKTFLTNDSIRGFLCLLNKEPRWNDNSLNLRVLQQLFEYLITETTRTKHEFIKTKDNGEGEFDVKLSYAIVNSADYGIKKESFINRLEDGKKVFIISTYQTMGAGQNLQYRSVHSSQLIDVRQNPQESWNTTNQTDINAIYLDKPTHLIQKIDKSLNEEGFIRYLFQLEFLLQSGRISIRQLNDQVTSAFHYLLASYNTKKEIPKSYNGYLYNDYNIKQHFAKYIIQAIGRICRTNLKSDEIFIHADIELDEYICDFKIDDNLVLNEFRALVKSAPSSNSSLDDDENLQLLLNKANLTNKKVRSLIKRFINRDWDWNEYNKTEWQRLRELCLRFPTISKDQVRVKGLNRIIDLFVELPNINDNYSYNQIGDYNDIEVSFDKNGPFYVSKDSARLEDILSIPGVRDYFITKSWATYWEKSEFILPPELFNNIYKGALGEEVGKFILEAQYSVQLEELPLEHFELFDFKIKDSDIYIDFKHWHEHTKISHANQIEKIRNKLERVKGERVLIVNLLAQTHYKVHSSRNNTIIEVPWLWNSDKEAFNKEILAYLP